MKAMWLSNELIFRLDKKEKVIYNGVVLNLLSVMKYTTKFFKEKGAEGGTATKEKLGRDHYVKMGKKSQRKRRKLAKELSPVVEIDPLLTTTP